MRHKVYGRHLSRNKNQRASLFKNLIGALILNSSIETTEAKAKTIKGLVDKIITQAKSDGSSSKNTQRLVKQFLTRKEVQEKLFKEVVPAVGNRNSGFTSMVKLGRRLGDKSMKVRMTLLTETVIASEAKQSRSETDQKKIATKPAASRNDKKPRTQRSVTKI